MNKTSTMPTSYQDFTKPEYKDKIVLTYPNDDDAVLYQFELMYVLPSRPHMPNHWLTTCAASKSSVRNGSTPCSPTTPAGYAVPQLPARSSRLPTAAAR